MGEMTDETDHQWWLKLTEAFPNSANYAVSINLKVPVDPDHHSPPRLREQEETQPEDTDQMHSDVHI